MHTFTRPARVCGAPWLSVRASRIGHGSTAFISRNSISSDTHRYTRAVYISAPPPPSRGMVGSRASNYTEVGPFYFSLRGTLPERIAEISARIKRRRQLPRILSLSLFLFCFFLRFLVRGFTFSSRCHDGQSR